MTGPDGTVVASYATVFENTSETINNRRSKLIRDLNEEVSAAEPTFSSLWPAFIRGLEGNDRDIPIAMVYANRTSGQDCPNRKSCTFTLEGTLGIPNGHECAPPEISLDDERHFLQAAFNKAKVTWAQVILQSSDGSLPVSALEGITWRGFEVPCSEVAICPVKSGPEIIAFVIIGLNPRKTYNVDYEQFLNQIIHVVAPKMSSILLNQERDRRATITMEAAVERDKMVSRLRQDMKFSRFADLAPISLCVTDSQGEIVYANESWHNFTGLDERGVKSMQWMESVIEEDRAILEEAWRILTVEKVPWAFQIRSNQPFQGYSDRSGPMEKQFKTGWCASYPELDEDGNVTSVMGIIVEISELKWTEEQVLSSTRELERSEAKYREFAINSPIGVSRMSFDGRREFTNAAWNLIFGYSPGEEGELTSWLGKAHPEDREKFARFFSDIQSSKTLVTVEIRLSRTWRVAAVQAGYPEQPVWILASGYAEVGATSEAHNIVCWVTEISAQKAAARAITDKMEEAILLKNRQENFIDM
jgi:PAS domain-containing protein